MRTLPKVLKYLPSDKAQDARNYVQSLQYWFGGNSENLENLLLSTAEVRACTRMCNRHVCVRVCKHTYAYVCVAHNSRYLVVCVCEHVRLVHAFGSMGSDGAPV